MGGANHSTHLQGCNLIVARTQEELYQDFKLPIQMEAAMTAWRTSGLTVPTNLLGYCAPNGWYAVASDTGTICTFMSKRGKVYACVKSKCRTQVSGGYGVWIIDGNALQVISCTKPSTDVERFVVDKIMPLFPTL